MSYRLTDLPAGLLEEPHVLAVLEAAAAYAGEPPEDALTHAVFNQTAQGRAAVRRLRDAGVLDDQAGVGPWYPAAESLLGSDPERTALLGRLCRYEAALLQALTLASRDTLRAELVARVPFSDRLARRAVLAGTGLPAADLAAAVAGALCLVPEGAPERIVEMTALEVQAAGDGPDPRRLDQAQRNHGLALDWAGRPSEALRVLRQRLLGAATTGDAIRTAIVALHAGKPIVAREALLSGLALAGEDPRQRLHVYLALAQLSLTEDGDLAAGRTYVDHARALRDAAPELAPDWALLDALVAPAATTGSRAERVHAAITEALEAGPPHQGRVCDRWVRLAEARRIPPELHAAVLDAATRSQSRGPQFASWVVVQAFLTLRAVAPRSPRRSGMAASADQVTAGRWQFASW